MNSSEQQMGETQYAQPSLYIVNAMLYYARIEDTGIKPDYLVGHSLGEYTALLAAEVFNFQTGLKLVKKRGELMSSQAGYGMAAVMGLLPEEVEQIIIDNHLTDLYIANYNTNNQTVISGSSDKLIIAEKIFYDNFAFNYVRLKVSNAFHSPYMDSA
jgi:malonyl CoA-acyl carrier protein transacylase